MDKRFFWADLIRIIAIYFVVANHVILLPEKITAGNAVIFIFFLFIKTAIPVFILLSGSLLLEKKESLKSFLKKRIVKVVVPWIFWTILYTALAFFSLNELDKTIPHLKYLFELTLFTKFWFLPLIVGIYILIPIWRKFVQSSKDRDVYYLIVVWMIFFVLLPYLHTSVDFPLYPGGYLPHALGYSIYIFLGLMITKKKLPFQGVTSAICITIFGIVWTVLDIILIRHQTHSFEFLSPNIVLTSTGFFALLFHFGERYRAKKNLKKIITRISTASFGIYILHLPIIEILQPTLLGFEKKLFDFNQIIGTIIISLLYFFISFIAVTILQKVPIVKLSLP